MADPDNNQTIFWEAMKEKYERRNESLRQQEICLRKRLEQLKQIMDKQKAGEDCDCVPEKLEKPSLVQCLVEKGKNLILGSCKCGDPKIGEDLLCACHIQDPKAPINVDPNLCPNQESPEPEGCLNTTCDFYDPTLARLAENPSTFSLKTTDIYYMDKLADLVKAEKNMQVKIEDLEKREHSYLTAIHDLQEAMKKQPRPDPMNKEFKKLTEGLEEENKKLRNEIQDLRLELKHCFERVEGPLRRSLEDQRDKCFKLENQLKDLQVGAKMKEDSYMKQINEVKAKLCQACCTMVDLNNVNAKLKNDLDFLQNKCATLEDELLKQQLKEAENILKFKNALARRSPKNKIQAKGDESEDLGHIAKKLGDTLKEVCPCVSDVPSGLAETAENIRQLTELVGEKGAQQRRKRKGRIHQVSTSSCACGSDPPSIPDTSTKPALVDSCTCSNSSLRLKPRVGKNDFTEDSLFGRSSATLASIPTMKIGAPKYASTPKSSIAPVKRTASKGCTCCPTTTECDHPNVEQQSIETLCSCTDVDKKIGPSEEVIAVKNLGTLSMPPGNVVCQAFDLSSFNQTKSRREKLAVDTTCDVLDTPPKDIHIVTTIAKTGSLEITTEGPPGIIETKVNYLPDGKIEIVTKLIDRHNMNNFLDGTLLHLPEGPPDCDESHTCGGQCEDISATGCPEVDCNKSLTCGGICDSEATQDHSEPAEEKLEVVADMATNEVVNNTSPYGQVVVNNNFVLKTNLLATKEWKNVNFQEDPMEETPPGDMVTVAKTKRKRQEKNAVHADVTSEEEMLRLSSRQSLTDVERGGKDDKTVGSSGSLVLHETLDTISEENEDLTDPSKTDNENEENSESDVSNGVIMEESDTTEKNEDPRSVDNEDVIQIEDNTAPEELKEEEVVGTSSTRMAEDFESSRIEDLARVTLPPQNLNDEGVDVSDIRESLKNCESATVTSSDCQITEAFFRLSKNLNVFNGRITLKQSKSMYEKKGSRSEYLRICKSATLSLGSLKIDMERLKLSSIGPNVGDFGGSRSEDRILPENIRFASKPPEEKDDKMISGALKEGCNFAETYQPVLEQTYQCYVCSCSNQKDKDDKQKKNVQNTRNNQGLEERIDRLLEIDPLATGHGVDCQCVDCLVQNAQRHNVREDCKCSRKKQEKPDPSTKRCKCGSKKEIPMIPKPEGPKHQGDNLQHGENCTCVDCICNPCNFKKDTSCDCPKCECDTCCGKDKRLTTLMTFELPKPQEITVMNVSMPCDCGGQCPCNPCMDASKKPKPAARPQPQPKAQETACKRCAGRVPSAEGAKKSDLPVGSSKIKAETKTVSPVATLPDTWKNVVGCSCAPTVDDKKAVCDCKTCECKPCGYPEKARTPCDCKPAKKERKPPSGKCDCKICQCESIGDTLNTSINCDCKLCECLFCSDLKARKQSDERKPPRMEAKEETIVPKKVPPGSQQKICGCKPKCLCDSCPVYAGTMEAKEETVVPKKVPPGSQQICGCKPKCLCESCPVYAETIGDVGGTKCDCAKCECDPCFDPHSPAVENLTKFLNEVKTREGEKKEKFDQKVSCDCGSTCECDDCKGKQHETSMKENIGDNGSKKTACDCATCDCENCAGKPEAEKNKGDVSDKIKGEPKKGQDKICPCMKMDTNEPVEECHDCGICSMVLAISTDEEEVEMPPSKIPCNCCKPCVCSPCPDPNIRGEQKPQMMGDADRAKEEIQNALNKIGCTCDQVEVNLQPLVKQASNFETTVSKMKMKLNNLQQKCKDKDQIIESMTRDLRMRSESGVFADLLHDLAHPTAPRYTPDFNRTYVCEFLPKPRHTIGAKLQPKRSSLCRFDNRLEPILELDRYLPGTKEEVAVCPKAFDVSGMEIIDIRRVTIDSILIKWRGPPCVTGVTGYQIFVNDELRYRVLSPNRTNAVIDSLDLSSSIEIMLFAITGCGRCEPPALATYRI
ncbi:uncharacterized protein LOC123313686 [Coccinella septempunctata]|uniref:uncharacterized protein LOC123313686 n=1 Tax=Coccinella septempunctata TaxID=41139 RepID=UPI001D079C51|nr:uncharacterized protein LOC123313686 [Coccinella septempunctata]